MNGKVVLFYDGCHKIYYAEATDTDTIKTMNSEGYETIIPEKFGDKLRELWADSCSLRFVDHANFDPKAPKVFQFQSGGLRGFLRDLKQYLEFMEGTRHGVK